MKGKVILVGAGPGAPDLITLRGLRALVAAEVVVADRLLPRDFLEQLGVGAKLEWLGDGPERPPQDEINRRLIEHARAGRRVVRLKGGDPLVFGQGEAEIAALAAAGIPWEIVPGLTAATAVPTAAGLPVTRHGQGRSFAVVTARTVGGEVNENLPTADTLVLFMGVTALPQTVSRLLAQGWPAATPAAIIERGTQPWERRRQVALAELPAAALAAGMSAPALIVVGVGAVGILADAPRPRVLFTGLDPEHFHGLGDLLHWPALAVVADEAGRRQAPVIIDGLRQGKFGQVVFTSRQGVASFFRLLCEAGLDARILRGAFITAAGAGTAARLREFGVLPEAVPEDAGSRGILAALGALSGASVLVVQGSHAPVGLLEAIAAQGGMPVRLSLHRVVPHPELGRPLPEHEVVYFVSPSGVNAYWQIYGAAAFQREIWAMGEVTLATLARRGYQGKVVTPHLLSTA